MQRDQTADDIFAPHPIPLKFRNCTKTQTSQPEINKHTANKGTANHSATTHQQQADYEAQTAISSAQSGQRTLYLAREEAKAGGGCEEDSPFFAKPFYFSFRFFIGSRISLDRHVVSTLFLLTTASGLCVLPAALPGTRGLGTGTRGTRGSRSKRLRRLMSLLKMGFSSRHCLMLLILSNTCFCSRQDNPEALH